MKKLLPILALILFSAPAWATTYYIDVAANGASDANNGTGTGTAWLSPNHAVNCGDVLQMAAGTTYSYLNFTSGKWGAVTCAGGNNVAWVKCITFDACKISSTASAYIVEITASYWGIQGVEVTGTTGALAGCFVAYPTGGSTIHHIIFANDIANGCMGGGFQSANNGSAGVDYLVYMGSIAYNAAQTATFCASGFSVAVPVASDTLPGTHILIAGNFAWANLDPSVCNGTSPTDGEGVIFDTFNGQSYVQQGAIKNNILIANGSAGMQVFQNTGSKIYVNYNTLWGNRTDTHNTGGTDCSEFFFNQVDHVEAAYNLVATNSATGCSGNNLYAYFSDTATTSVIYNSWGYSASGFNDNYAGTSPYGPGNTFGTNPNYANPTVPGAPSCGSASSVPNCMATVIANFTPTTAAAKAYGYQPVSTTSVYDPLYPQWLCTVTNLPTGLVTPGCVTGSAINGVTISGVSIK
jgi:hypothetical protein